MSHSIRNYQKLLFSYSILCCLVDRLWASHSKILMHICFQCGLDYSLWTKPKIWLLFWKMLKKTSESNNLHSKWGTWCSQILCGGSYSLVQPALNRGHQQACHQLAAQSQVPWHHKRHSSITREQCGNRSLCAGLKCSFCFTDRGRAECVLRSWEIIQEDEETQAHSTLIHQIQSAIVSSRTIQLQEIKNSHIKN